MAPSDVSIWKQCLKDLQHLPSVINNPEQQLTPMFNVGSKLEQWKGLPAPSARVWRQLVLEVKVPEVLFAVCSSVVPTQPTSSAALGALDEFLWKAAAKDGLFSVSQADSGRSSMSADTTTSSSSSSSSSPQSLATIIRSQVLQSGLMDTFAAAMTATANSLQATSDPNQPPFQDRPDARHTAAADTAIGIGGSYVDSALKEAPLITSALLLSTWAQVCQLWPEGRDQLAIAAVAAPAAMQLSAAILQVVSRDLPAAAKAAPEVAGLTTGGAPTHSALLNNAVQELLNAVYTLVYSTSVLDRSWLSMPELQPLLTVPEFTTVLATMVVVTAEALLARQKLGPTAAANASSTSAGTSSTCSTSTNSKRSACQRSTAPSSTPSTDSSSRNSAIGKPSTKINRKLEAVLRNLPECTKALLETLGMDSRAMVWAAAAQRDRATADDLDSIAVTLVHVLCWQFAADSTAAQTAQQQTERQKLLLQVPALLLYWTANTPISTEQEMLQSTLNVVFSTHQCIHYWLQQPHITSYAQSIKCRGLGLDIDTITCQWLQPYLPAVWLEQVLPDVQKLLAVLLPYCLQQQATSTASRSPGAPCAAADVLQREGVGQLHESVRVSGTAGESTTTMSEVLSQMPVRLVGLQCRVLQSAVGNDPEGDRVGAASACQEDDRPIEYAAGVRQGGLMGSGPYQLTQPLAEFRGVTVQTLASLEGFIRASAQQLAAGSMLDSKVPWAINTISAALVNLETAELGPLLSLAVAAGPASSEQQQLYSLSSSLIKLSALGANSSDATLATSLCYSCFITAGVATTCLLLSSHVVLNSKVHDRSTSNTSSSSSSAVEQRPKDAQTHPDTETAGAAGDSSQAPSPSAVTLLPSLVLVGRCCLMLAQHMQQAVPQLLQVHAGMGSITPQQALQHRSVTPPADVLLWLWLKVMQESQESGGSTTTACNTPVSHVLNWLTAPAVADQLAAAGHDTQQLPQLLQQLLSACRTAAEAWPTDNFNEATAMALVQQLQVTGRALAGLAVPTMCCNPSCSNITGPSDLQLVSGRSCLCGGCRTARYCSRICQKAAWKQHKPACSALAAAAAAAAPSSKPGTG